MAADPDRRPDAIDTTVQKTYRWLRELGEETGLDRDAAFDVLRGFLHTLRDRLTVDEGAHLSAELPMLIRGLYYEAWDPSRLPRKMKAGEFLESFELQSRSDAGLEALKAANRVLRRHISEGEALDVLSSLPKDIRELLE